MTMRVGVPLSSASTYGHAPYTALFPYNNQRYSTGDAMKNVVCYFSNWASHREGAGKFVPENVDASKCSHVFYAFASLDGEKMEILPQVH